MSIRNCRLEPGQREMPEKARAILAAVVFLLVAGTAMVGVPVPAAAQVSLLPDEVERIDVIAIEIDDRDVFAFDALSGRRSRLRLEIGEKVYFSESRGRVGLLLTDRRALGIAPGIDFQETRYRIQEGIPEVGLIEDRIALVVTGRRALGFVGASGWIEERFSPQESAEALRVGAAAGIVATNRRALGLAPDGVSFVSTNFRIKEKLESVSAQDTLVSVRTNRRILVFSAPRSFWTAQDRTLN
ncbi:MAG: hypothetical protein AB8G23_19595 [Myxococcota bacterium]